MNSRMRKVVWNWKEQFFEWFHVIYASIVILSAVSVLWPDHKEVKVLALQIAFLVYFVILLVFFILFTFKFSRKARYSEATKCTHGALHSARDSYHYLDWCKSDQHNDVHFDEGRLRDYMKTTLTSIADAFTIVSGVRCRGSLKIIGQNSNNQLYVRTLARDEVSQTECKNVDDPKSESHLISKNTDFHLIAEGNLNYFFSGDLKSYQNYVNTSVSNHSDRKGQDWGLPYISTIVWPIRYVYEGHEMSDSDNVNEDLYGFLTIDSTSKNAFIERYDVQMGAMLADALFPVLNAYMSLKSKQ